MYKNLKLKKKEEEFRSRRLLNIRSGLITCPARGRCQGRNIGETLLRRKDMDIKV
jgi:hypothetical protein